MNKFITILIVLVIVVGLGVFVFNGRQEQPVNDISLSEENKSQAEVLYENAVSLESAGNYEKAAGVYQDLIKKFPDSEFCAQALNKLGGIYEGNREFWQKAKEAYSRIISDFPDFKQIADVEKKLWNVNVKILFSPFIAEGDILYKVEPGDTLTKIAAKYNTTVELIKRSNNLKNDLIRPGNRLKISPLKCSVIVDKSQNVLTLKTEEGIFKVYSVATGKYNSTPVGTFKIIEKLKDPNWYSGDGRIIPPNVPENILGTRWMGLSERQYGIHGGAVESDLGLQVTKGCVRMLNSEVEELFTILPKGTEVTIVN